MPHLILYGFISFCIAMILLLIGAAFILILPLQTAFSDQPWIFDHMLPILIFIFAFIGLNFFTISYFIQTKSKKEN